MHSKSQEEKRPWVHDYDWFEKKFCCPRSEIWHPESSSVSQAATVCKEKELLPKYHIPAWTLSSPFHFCRVLEADIQWARSSTSILFLFLCLLGRTQYFTILYFLLPAEANNIYVLLFWTVLLGLTGHICSEDCMGLLQDRVAAGDTHLVPFLTLLKVLS